VRQESCERPTRHRRERYLRRVTVVLEETPTFRQSILVPKLGPELPHRASLPPFLLQRIELAAVVFSVVIVLVLILVGLLVLVLMLVFVVVLRVGGGVGARA
jgi:hypothetical protein